MSFLNNGKSQSSLLILISLVVIIAILLLFYLFSSVSIQERILFKTQLTKITDYLNVFKGFSKQTSVLASHSAAKEVAGSGGDNVQGGEARSWICNNDRKPPTVNEVRYFLGEETKGSLNNYISNLWVEDIPDIYFSNFTCSDINVNELGVSSGLNDEKYDVNSFGSFVEVAIKNNTASSTNDASVQVAQVRFWYLYRVFKQWAEATPYPDDAMSCISEGTIYGTGVGQWCDNAVPQSFRSCIENSASKAAQELEKLFSDPYIKCSYKIGCICAGISKDCRNVNYPCAKCDRTEAGELCGSKVVSGGQKGAKHLLNKTGEQSVFLPVDIQKRYLTFSVDVDIQWCNLWGLCGVEGDLSVWGAMSTTFSCRDTKYALSVS